MMNRPIFIIENVSKQFKSGDKKFYALKDVNLEFDQQGLVCVTGKSGSGKSTFLNIISGIEKVSSGEALFNNKNISKFSDRQFSKYHLDDISLIYQHYNLFSDLTALENVLIPLEMKGDNKHDSIDKAKQLFESFNLLDLMNKKVSILSGGEKQRVAIIRSLITEPNIILCDEPTGALDYKNSILIMEILKEISKTKLVILVSHNLELVNRYADRIIGFRDGKVLEDKTVNKTDTTNDVIKRKYKYSSKWIDRFLKLNFKRNIKKTILSFLTLVLGFSAIFLSIGFSFGAKQSQKNALETNLEMAYSTVSETTYIKIDNSPLSFEKNVRPQLSLIDEKLNGFKTVQYAENLSYFFTNFPIGKYIDKELEEFEMIPIYKISENNYQINLLCGNLPNESIDEVLVNKEFVDEIGISYNDAIGKEISISYSTEFSVPSNDKDNPIIKDSFSYNLNLKISGVINEFSFLNKPKIYYSYIAARDFLKSQYSDVISKNRGKVVTYFDLIEESPSDNVMTSYSSIIFLTSLSEKDRYFDLIKTLNDDKDNLKITSTGYDIENSYATFINSFSSALYVFVIISFIGTNFIIGMISLSNFIQYKKESAILTCLGARNKSIIFIYLIENYIVLFLTLLFSTFISTIAQKFINQIILSKFSLSNLINIPFMKFQNITFGLPILLLLISILVISIFTLVPLLVYRNISLSDELRDE